MPLTEDEIFTLLGQYHLVGRKDWSVFEQAAYLYRQKKASNLEIDTLAKSVGLSEGKVKTFISVYVKSLIFAQAVFSAQSFQFFLYQLRSAR